MLYSQLLGGLGNCLFITATLYSLSIDKKLPYCVSNNTQSCTKRKEEEEWLRTILKSVPKVGKRPKQVKTMYREKSMRYKHFPKKVGSTQLHGYFQSDKYFSKNKSKVISLFTEYKKEIQFDLDKKFPSGKETISIHVRRADYLRLQHAHVVQPEQYYEDALKAMSNKLGYKNDIEQMNKDYRFVIFSDDIEWCQTESKTFSKLKDVHFMGRNSAIEDMYLMSMCDHHIIANSTFSWWGSYLNEKKNVTVVAPKAWFALGYKKPEEWQDIYCKDWIRV